MRILFTGGSSFTGYWFIRELALAGHEVHATFTQRGIEEYTDLRSIRISEILNLCIPHWGCRFGDERFLQIVKQGNWDLLCHHGAYVHDYKSLDFDVVAALQANTNNARDVLSASADSGCNKLLLTGSVFEQREGFGEKPIRAFSPYGLSKGLTAEVLEFWCAHYGIDMARFVIPNPFGPFEEKRFTAYLINAWQKGQIPKVNTPAYVRDNIHVSLLAILYRKFAEEIIDRNGGARRLNPSGYVETQGAFASRVANEMRDRLNLPCVVDFAVQQDFPEPRIRINCDQVDWNALEWNETVAWDDFAEFYLAGGDR